MRVGLSHCVALSLLIAPTASLALGRRACLLGTAALLPKACSASYAMGVAAQQAHSWDATGAAREQAVYNAIDQKLDEKRRFRDDPGSLGYVGGDYTNYRRGDGRERWEEEQRLKKKSSDVASDYARAQDFLVMTQARRIASP